jgi:uncharacterized protein YggT (Ycf19 family)
MTTSNVDILLWVINRIEDILIILIFLNVFLPYFLHPGNRIRSLVDQVVEPALNQVRRVIRPIGRFDFSPLVLLILVQLVSFGLQSIVRSLLR